ncbi:MAG: SCO4848 family membrane protein [Sciscionella sp.]
MRLSKTVSIFFVLFGVWSLWIWITLVVNISADPRAFDSAGKPTAFFLVHLVLAIVSVILGLVIGGIGVRGLRSLRAPRESSAPRATADSE